MRPQQREGDRANSTYTAREIRELGIPVTIVTSRRPGTPPRNKDVTGTAIKASTGSSTHLSMYSHGRDNGGTGGTQGATPRCVNTLNLVRACRSTKHSPSLFPFRSLSSRENNLILGDLLRGVSDGATV